MTNIELIITLARHYCIENYDYWFKKYSHEKSGQMYSDKDYDLFPRYNVLTAILQEIEGIIDKKYYSVNDCIEELKIIGSIAQTIFTENEKNKIANNAMNDERNKFVYFVENIMKNDLNNVSPLPYNRKLSKIESKEIREKLFSIWKFDGGYWEHSKDKNEVIFLMDKYITESDRTKIVEYISKHNRKYYTVDEMENDYETEIIEICGCETVYTNINFEWIIYISHEMYVAFSGVFLIRFLNDLFSDRMEKINIYEW
jgi:hypothetical protein